MVSSYLSNPSFSKDAGSLQLLIENNSLVVTMWLIIIIYLQFEDKILGYYNFIEFSKKTSLFKQSLKWYSLSTTLYANTSLKNYYKLRKLEGLTKSPK